MSDEPSCSPSNPDFPGGSQTLSDPFLRQIRALLQRIAHDLPEDRELKSICECLELLATQLEIDRRALRRAVERLENNQHSMNTHIVGIENSLIYAVLRRLGQPILGWRARFRRLFPRSLAVEYRSWLEREESKRLFRNSRDGQTELRWAPKFTLILLIEEPEPPFLKQAIASVVRQTYGCWELHIVGNASGCTWVTAYLSTLARSDNRIRFSQHDSRLPRSAALNDAISLANGDYIVFFSSTTVLVQDGLEEIARNVQDRVEVVYSDEGETDLAGAPTLPVFKPDWSPDLLMSFPYVGQLLAVTKDALASLGGIRPGFEGAELYDLLLRFMGAGVIGRHIPAVLCHGYPTPPAVAQSTQKALEAYIQQHEPNSTVTSGRTPGTLRIQRQFKDEAPLVSLIICSRSADLLGRCLESIEKITRYKQLQIIVVEHVGPDGRSLAQVTAKHGAKCLCYEGPFHFSRMNNQAAEAADGSILVFLNDDTEPLSPEWLRELALHAERPEVGVVGAKLLYPSGTLQHAGLAVGIHDGCGHPGRGGYGSPLWRWLDLTRNVSAVTGACLTIRKEVFTKLGGFSEAFPVNYNDADLCLRASQAGYTIVYEPAVVLRHYESLSRSGGVKIEERERWYGRWSSHLRQGDPFYSPNLTQVSEDLSLGFDE